MGVQSLTATNYAEQIYVPGRSHGVSLTLGERDDRAPGDHTPDAIYQAATTAPIRFSYGSPVTEREFYLPRRGLYTFATLPWRSVAWFVDSGAEIVAHDQASQRVLGPYTPSGIMAHTMDLLESQHESLREVVFEASYKQWSAPGGVIPEVMQMLRQLFVQRHDQTPIRTDADDPHGTHIWLGSSGAMNFLLVERSRIVQRRDGTQMLNRVLEVAKVADPQEALDVINEFSLTEEMRVRLKADQLNITEEELGWLAQYANRANVQSDGDVARLLNWYRYPPQPFVTTRVARAIWRAVQGSPQFMHNVLSNDNKLTRLLDGLNRLTQRPSRRTPAHSVTHTRSANHTT